MRLVLSWLREMVPFDLSPEALAELLAGKGAHLESIERPWSGLEGVVVARVVEVRDHPDSTKLCVARVSSGSAETQVVVGVRNMREGDLVPFAPPGARVPALPDALGVREIRGQVSNGMLCSPRELALSQDHGGILILPDGELEPGEQLKSALGLDEVVLDLEIESNRPDLLSVMGLAREVAAATGSPLSEPDASVSEGPGETSDVATVEVRDAGGCPRYLARVVRGVGPGATPLRIQARLSAAGVRPISAAVDATNYVMIELGQPLHAFDLRRLAGPGIVVRRAGEGERLVTLDGVERELLATDLLICDLERPVAIAGVMGGQTSEVGPDTKDVLIESAYFDPRSVLRTSRRLQLLSEASIRFSRGTDPEGVGVAASRAARLMIEWSGAGELCREAIDAGGAPPRRTLEVRPARATALLGYDVDAASIAEALGRIRVPAAVRTDGLVEVEVPGFRPDILAEVDAIEEVVRVHGYDRLPSTTPAIRRPGAEQPSYALRRRAVELLVRGGLRETTSLSFASAADLEAFGDEAATAVAVANPPSADEPFLRARLAPSLLRAVVRNADRGTRGVALFEVGHVFRLGGPVEESEHVAAVLSGPVGEDLWSERRSYDALDAKGAFEVLADGLGAAFALGDPPGGPFHPGRSAWILVGGSAVGALGELHPAAAARLGLVDRVALFEVDLPALAAGGRYRGFRDVPRFPPLRRDLAFVVDDGVPSEALRGAIVEAGGELLDRCVLFDVHEGPPVPEGRKSLAFSLSFRSPDRTLTDEDADRAVAAIAGAVGERFAAELRSG